MKILAVGLTTLSFFSLPCLAQLTLNPGESYTHRFTSLPFNVLIGASEQSGGFDVGFANFQTGSTLRLEMWEGEMVGPPIKSVQSNISSAVSCSLAGAWGDQEGTLRFTMLSGYGTVGNVQVWAFVNSGSPNSYAFHSKSFSPPFAPPQISIASRSNAVEVSWWSNGYAGFVLERTNTIPSSTWLSVTQTPALVAGRKVVTLSSTGQITQFFRLRK